VIWETVVGLEVHVQLKTRSKIFCACATTFGDPPNTNVCPVCLGLPGALPVLNREAVRLATRAALALNFTVHDRSVFARKNYFYPDLPKGYQISQFDHPVATGGSLRIISPERGPVDIRITRLHLEEDAGKSFHDRFPGVTAVDLNRSGVPLAEIVSEPDIRSPAEARAYLVALKQILEYVEVSDCNMEEGSLRVDGNLSVRPLGQQGLGTKQEVKNLNSFAAVEKALSMLRDRQIASLTRDEPVVLTTYSAASGELRAMRTKEESHDYRYFPDPDLAPLVLSQFGIHVAAEQQAVPELPAAKQRRFTTTYALPDYDASVLSSTRTIAGYFESIVAAGAEPKAAANWVMGTALADANEHGGMFRVAPERVARLISLVEGGTVSHQAAKRVFVEMAASDETPDTIAERLGLVQVADVNQLAQWVRMVLDRHPGEIERYRAGDSKLLGFFMGAVMKESKGRADPKLVQQALRKTLEN
jgi:aspartyl-tRNA(Asn)/glutamyl-tRNA(Gln) amidotransferase subunit B